MSDAALVGEVLEGLSSCPKRLPAKLFYDEHGAALFEAICGLEEYYPTRTEISILRQEIGEIARELGPAVTLFELGSGSSTKTRILLDQLDRPARYVPIDICPEFLAAAERELRRRYPELGIAPVRADFCDPDQRAGAFAHAPGPGRRAAFFPGSTIGNFMPPEAERFLQGVGQALGRDGLLLIGVDLLKDPEALERAYNDSQGITRDFNLNVLRRLNRELAADFKLSAFRHHAFFNRELSRIEMHLVCLRDCRVAIAGRTIPFLAGESIHTESSYKYSPERFERLARLAGFRMRRLWSDPRRYFGVFLLEVSA